jgi:hypothetical protein
VSDDLTALFAPPAPGPSQDVRWRQGTILTFDPVTLVNTVDVGGTTMTNLPILGVAEAASLAAGSVVGLLAIESTLGTVSYAILGRLVTPNTAAATDAITLLSQGTAAAFVAATESTTSVAFTDLTTPGPAVSVTIRASGKALVFVGATIAVNPAAGALWGGFMNFFMSGANVLAAGSPGGLGYSIGAGASPDNLELSAARMIPLSGLNPGLTTFTAKYAIGVGAVGETASFRNRSIAVFAL